MSQNDKVLRLLVTRWEGITSMDAIRELGVTRLAARISELRDAGNDIRSQMVEVENRDGSKARVARYRLVA